MSGKAPKPEAAGSATLKRSFDRTWVEKFPEDPEESIKRSVLKDLTQLSVVIVLLAILAYVVLTSRHPLLMQLRDAVMPAKPKVWQRSNN